jgi:REP element-mobilizing transposase RayT
MLANPETHAAFCDFAERGWRERGIAVGRYVIMPDHLHVFVAGGRGFHLSQWVRQLKVALTREPKLWQRGFFDHLLRSEESYAQKWEYVHQNPVRAGLVERVEDWPYQGEVVAIEHR